MVSRIAQIVQISLFLGRTDEACLQATVEGLALLELFKIAFKRKQMHIIGKFHQFRLFVTYIIHVIFNVIFNTHSTNSFFFVLFF
jgi:hypothetical protein